MIVTYSGNDNALGYILGTDERIVSKATPRPAPPKIIQRLKLARQDGSKVVANYEDEKVIEVEGHLTTPTISGFRGLVDEFKRELSYPNAKVTIEEDDGTKRDYIASIDDLIDIPYEHHHVTYSPFKFNLIASDPYGYDQAFTTWSGTTISGYSYSIPTLTFSGTKEPLPLFNYYITASGQISGIEFLNSDNNQSIRIDRPYGAYQYNDNDVLSVDCGRLRVELNGNEVTYSGVFPQFELGANNNLKSNFYRDLATNNLQQNINIGVAETPNFPAWVAQSFTPAITGNCQWVELLMRKQGAPDNIMVEIRTDSGGQPSDIVLCSDGMLESWFTTPYTWVKRYWSSPPALTAGVTYWIVIRSNYDDRTRYNIANKYFWNYCAQGVYSKNRAYSLTGALTWIVDNSAFLFHAYITTANDPSYNQLVNLEIKWKNRWR